MRSAFFGWGTTVALLLVAGAEPAHACAACFGASDSAMARGMNAGILSLLGVVGFVLVGVAAFFVFLVVRSARARATEQAVGRSHDCALAGSEPGSPFSRSPGFAPRVLADGSATASLAEGARRTAQGQAGKSCASRSGFHASASRWTGVNQA